MEKYESKIGSIPAKIEDVYAVLSNLESFDRVRDLIPQDKVQEIEITADAIHMKVDGLGQRIVIRIVDRIENDTVKFGIDNLPLEMNFWIQLKAAAEMDTRIRLTLKADIPMMFKMMLGSKIQKGLDDGVDMMVRFPYAQWRN